MGPGGVSAESNEKGLEIGKKISVLSVLSAPKRGFDEIEVGYSSNELWKDRQERKRGLRVLVPPLGSFLFEI